MVPREQILKVELLPTSSPPSLGQKIIFENLNLTVPDSEGAAYNRLYVFHAKKRVLLISVLFPENLQPAFWCKPKKQFFAKICSKFLRISSLDVRRPLFEKAPPLVS